MYFRKNKTKNNNKQATSLKYNASMNSAEKLYELTVTHMKSKHFEQCNGWNNKVQGNDGKVAFNIESRRNENNTRNADNAKQCDVV